VEGTDRDKHSSLQLSDHKKFYRTEQAPEFDYFLKKYQVVKKWFSQVFQFKLASFENKIGS
jgi:hypothetical protein